MLRHTHIDTRYIYIYTRNICICNTKQMQTYKTSNNSCNETAPRDTEASFSLGKYDKCFNNT